MLWYDIIWYMCIYVVCNTIFAPNTRNSNRWDQWTNHFSYVKHFSAPRLKSLQIVTIIFMDDSTPTSQTCGSRRVPHVCTVPKFTWYPRYMSMIFPKYSDSIPMFCPTNYIQIYWVIPLHIPMIFLWCLSFIPTNLTPRIISLSGYSPTIFAQHYHSGSVLYPYIL